MKHRTTCHCNDHDQPLESARAQAVFIIGMVVLAAGLALVALLILRGVSS